MVNAVRDAQLPSADDIEKMCATPVVEAFRTSRRRVTGGAPQAGATDRRREARSGRSISPVSASTLTSSPISWDQQLHRAGLAVRRWRARRLPEQVEHAAVDQKCACVAKPATSIDSRQRARWLKSTCVVRSARQENQRVGERAMAIVRHERARLRCGYRTRRRKTVVDEQHRRAHQRLACFAPAPARQD
jgi:hypothetical protein